MGHSLAARLLNLTILTEATPNPNTCTPSRGLGASARASLLWGGGFTLLRDVAQFGVMLILVRLLTPADYGTAAVAQAIIGVAAGFSYATFSLHALQMRDPADVDWQVHFTSGAVLNTVVAVLVLLLAFGLSLSKRFHDVALPLAALSVVFLIEIPGTLRHRMLEAHHDWKRFRLLLTIGTFLGLGLGLLVALLGGGVWALIVQPPMFSLPAAIDLLLIQRFRPDWTWHWARWRDTLSFGLDRTGSGLIGRGRILIEQMLVSGLYDLATLGIFSRANGLAMLIAGRIGSLAMMSLYPVVTRADSGSARFQRLADLVLRGVVWITLPISIFLGIVAHDTVALLYGPQWGAVTLLLPLAAFAVGLGGIITALSSLLVANNNSRYALSLDVIAAISGIAVAVILIPFGVRTYLAGLCVHATVVAMVAVVLLVRRGGASRAGVASAFVPAAVSATMGALGIVIGRAVSGGSDWFVVRLLSDGMLFGTVSLLVLRFAFSQPLAELIDVAPGGAWMRQRLKLASP